MSKITFYRQARVDGGVRTGVTVDDDTVMGCFTPGKSRIDPSLKWFVDVRCEGNLPSAPEDARQWFLDHEEIIKRTLLDLAEKLRAGMDVDAHPAVLEARKPPADVRVEVACAATNRLDAREISKALTRTARGWRVLLAGLRVLQPA